jgi:hypothetical protein
VDPRSFSSKIGPDNILHIVMDKMVSGTILSVLRKASRQLNAPIEQKAKGRQDPDEFSSRTHKNY